MAENEDLAAQQDAARRKGMRQNPLFQTATLDTTGTGGQIDIATMSPAFDEAHEATLRRAATVVSEDRTDPTVVLPEDEREADQAKADITAQAEELDSEKESDEKSQTSKSGSESSTADSTSGSESTSTETTGSSTSGETKSTDKDSKSGTSTKSSK